MFLSNSLVVLAILLVAGIAWCVFVVRRLPSDLAELREQLAKYRASKTSEALGRDHTIDQQRRYQRECATEFWTTLAGHVCFFWPVTVLVVALFLVPRTWWMVSSILNALRSLLS